jgi:hypothetical protein
MSRAAKGKQPEALSIRDPFQRALLRRLDDITAAMREQTQAITALRERIAVFVQRPACPVAKGAR